MLEFNSKINTMNKFKIIDQKSSRLHHLAYKNTKKYKDLGTSIARYGLKSIIRQLILAVPLDCFMLII